MSSIVDIKKKLQTYSILESEGLTKNITLDDSEERLDSFFLFLGPLRCLDTSLDAGFDLLLSTRSDQMPLMSAGNVRSK